METTSRAISKHILYAFIMRSSDWIKSGYPSRLRAARQREGLTQAALASRCGTTQEVISRAENSTNPRLPVRQALMDFVDVSERNRVTTKDELLQTIARSPELAALIKRIAAEL